MSYLLLTALILIVGLIGGGLIVRRNPLGFNKMLYFVKSLFNRR